MDVSPLPKLPVTSLKGVTSSNSIEITLDEQSSEEENINGSASKIPYRTTFQRYPFVLVLDGIVCSTHDFSSTLYLIGCIARPRQSRGHPSDSILLRR